MHSISFVPELTPADSDQVMLPDLNAVYICPWDNTTAIIFADLFWEDKPYNVCPRQALKIAMQKSKVAVPPNSLHFPLLYCCKLQALRARRPQCHFDKQEIGRETQM